MIIERMVYLVGLIVALFIIITLVGLPSLIGAVALLGALILAWRLGVLLDPYVNRISFKR